MQPSMLSRATPVFSGAVIGAVETIGQAGAQTALGITDEIIQAANNVRVNKRAALALSRRVQEMAATIVSLAEDASMTGINWEQLDALQSFGRILEDVRVAIESLAGTQYLTQLLHERRDREKMLDLSERARNAFNTLMVGLRAQAQALSMGLTAKLDALAEKHDAQLASLADTLSEPHARVPPKPQLHFGREAETKALVDLVISPDGRATVLGGPGMGKTTLAVAVAHHPSVIAHFGARRFFVPCDAAEGRASLLPTLAAAFGITGADPKMMKLKLLERLASDPTLLLLDNFESAWEAENQREDAEGVLLFLDTIKPLSLVLTLRGAERPGGVHWTRPLLTPLEPLTENDSRQIFESIVHTPGTDSQGVSELLSNLDNIPLAVVLMANLAQVETVQSLLCRWRDAQTAMLVRGDGQQRLTSLDISISLSVLSPRMQAVPMAHRILSLLSLLPDGAANREVPMLCTDTAAVSALLQTALVLRRGPERIFVLAPIRSFMLANAVLRQALAHSNQRLRRSALHAVNCLARQYSQTRLGAIPELFPLAFTVAKEAGDDVLHAELLVNWARIASGMCVSGNMQGLLREAKAIYERIGHATGVLDCRMGLIRWCTAQDMVYEARRIVAESQATDDHRRTGRYTIDLAEALQWNGQMSEAAAQAELGIALLQSGGPESGPDMQLGMALKCLGQVHHQVGALAEAVNAYLRCLDIFEASEYALGRSMVNMYLAFVYLVRGDPRSAVVHAARTVDNARDAPSFVDAAYRLHVMAEAHAMMGNVDDASDSLERLEHTARVLELTRAATRYRPKRLYGTDGTGPYPSRTSLTRRRKMAVSIRPCTACIRCTGLGRRLRSLRERNRRLNAR